MIIIRWPNENTRDATDKLMEVLLRNPCRRAPRCCVGTCDNRSLRCTELRGSCPRSTPAGNRASSEPGVATGRSEDYAGAVPGLQLACPRDGRDLMLEAGVGADVGPMSSCGGALLDFVVSNGTKRYS